MEGNPSTHLALSSVGFTKYRERSIECVRLLMRWADEQQIKANEEEEGQSPPLNFNARDRLGRTLMHLICQHGLVSLVDEIFKRAPLGLTTPDL